MGASCSWKATICCRLYNKSEAEVVQTKIFEENVYTSAIEQTTKYTTAMEWSRP